MKKSFLGALLESLRELSSWIVVIAMYFICTWILTMIGQSIFSDDPDMVIGFSMVFSIWVAYTFGNRLIGDYFRFKRGIMISKIALGLTIILGAGYALFINVPLWAFIISILLVLILLVLVLIAFK